jgi:hypothetical protein
LFFSFFSFFFVLLCFFTLGPLQELEQAIAMSLFIEQERLDLAVRQAEEGASRKLQGLEVYTY